MHDVSSFCYLAGVVLGVGSVWNSRLIGPAIAAIALGLLLIGR